MSELCFKDLQKEANNLFRPIHLSPRAVWEKRLAILFNKSHLAGPLAVAHLLAQCRKTHQKVIRFG